MLVWGLWRRVRRMTREGRVKGWRTKEERWRVDGTMDGTKKTEEGRRHERGKKRTQNTRKKETKNEPRAQNVPSHHVPAPGPEHASCKPSSFLIRTQGYPMHLLRPHTFYPRPQSHWHYHLAFHCPRTQVTQTERRNMGGRA